MTKANSLKTALGDQSPKPAWVHLLNTLYMKGLIAGQQMTHFSYVSYKHTNPRGFTENFHEFRILISAIELLIEYL